MVRFSSSEVILIPLSSKPIEPVEPLEVNLRLVPSSQVKVTSVSSSSEIFPPSPKIIAPVTSMFALRLAETKFNSSSPSPVFGANLKPPSTIFNLPPASASAVISIEFSPCVSVKTVSLVKESSCLVVSKPTVPLMATLFSKTVCPSLLTVNFIECLASFGKLSSNFPSLNVGINTTVVSFVSALKA